MAIDDANRQRRTLDTFVQLADTMASGYEVGELLQFLVDRTHDILAADTAGVLLETPDGVLRLAAATSHIMHEIEAIELSEGQGPCIDAYRSAGTVVAPDLAADEDRWPKVVPQLLDMGMHAGYAFPLQVRADCIGALNIYRRSSGHFDDDDLRIGQAFADVAAIGIMQQRRVADAEERAGHLQRALDSRVIIEQAKGVVAQQHGVTPATAFEALRRHARSNRMGLHALARQVVEGVTSPADLTRGETTSG
jgi:GAF domain-containing protein